MVHKTLSRFSDWVLDAAGAVLLLLVIACIIVTTIAVLQHSGDLKAVKDNTSQTQTAVQGYTAEQTALAKAGKYQLAFAEWLAESEEITSFNQMSLCTKADVTCAALPPLPQIPGVKK